MGTYKHAVALEKAIKRACKKHDNEEIGVVLSALLVEVAQFIGMPKAQFLKILEGLWDIKSGDATDNLEVH